MQALILLIFAILAGCHGYSYVIPPNLKTPGICFYNGLILPKGDSQIPMVCQHTDCREDGSIMVDGCRQISLPNCTLIEYISKMKSYPDCCEMTYECIDADGKPYTKEWNQLNPTNSNGEIVPIEKEYNSNGVIVPPEIQYNSNGEIVPQEKQHKIILYKIFSPFTLQMLLFV